VDPAADRHRPSAAALHLAAAAVAAAVSSWAAIRVLGTASNHCDNEVGTCIRGRQQLAILIIDVACVSAATAALFMLARSIKRTSASSWFVPAAILITLFAAAVLVVDPVQHLNHRWDGWLGA
jgi:hypothetical protein